MSIAIKQKTVDVLFTVKQQIGPKGPVQTLEGEVATTNRKFGKSEKVLRLHFSLMGETSPMLTELSPDHSMDEKTAFYRYDWIVGATLIEPCYDWPWFAEISEKRAVVVQLLVDTGESGCGVSECNPFLLGMQPSKDTVSWVDRNKEKLGESLARLSDVTESFSKIATGILKTSAVMSNFVSSSEDGKKNWFIYRFLDEKRKCYAIEWNINRTVLHQYEPVLRGSILLAYHGGSKPSKPATLLLRPRLNFGKDDRMDYVPPWQQLEGSDPVALSVNPLPG